MECSVTGYEHMGRQERSNLGLVERRTPRLRRDRYQVWSRRRLELLSHGRERALRGGASIRVCFGLICFELRSCRCAGFFPDQSLIWFGLASVGVLSVCGILNVSVCGIQFRGGLVFKGHRLLYHSTSLESDKEDSDVQSRGQEALAYTGLEHRAVLLMTHAHSLCAEKKSKYTTTRRRQCLALYN